MTRISIALLLLATSAVGCAGNGRTREALQTPAAASRPSEASQPPRSTPSPEARPRIVEVVPARAEAPAGESAAASGRQTASPPSASGGGIPPADGARQGNASRAAVTGVPAGVMVSRPVQAAETGGELPHDAEPGAVSAPASQSGGFVPTTAQRSPHPSGIPDLPVDAVAQILVQPAFDAVEVGSTITVQVSIRDAADVSSVPFHLLYDPAILEFQGAQEGPFLGGDGNPTVFMVAPNAAGSRVIVGHSRLGRDSGIDGSGHLCSLTFLAVAPGPANLSVERASAIQVSGSSLPSRFDVFPLDVR